MKLTYYTDPGHGWIAAPLTLVSEWGITPTRYSYRDGALAYLEEDCDAAALMREARSRGVVIQLTERFSAGDSFIRSLCRFEE